MNPRHVLGNCCNSTVVVLSIDRGKPLKNTTELKFMEKCVIKSIEKSLRRLNIAICSAS